MLNFVILGVIMKGLNARYFKKIEDFYFEFIPQIIFMLLTFGWMDAMIFIKWSTVPGHNPPSLITTFMDMALSLGAPPDDQDAVLGESNRSLQHSLQTAFFGKLAVFFLINLFLSNCCHLHSLDVVPKAIISFKMSKKEWPFPQTSGNRKIIRN